MKQIILSLSIMMFLISCGPSKAELEARQKQEYQQSAGKMETQEFYDGGNHSATVHIVEVDGCTYYYFCSTTGLTVIHNPHCTKTSE